MQRVVGWYCLYPNSYRMALRWRIGIYLGVADMSGEHFVGVRNGDVVRTRSVVRIVESARWKPDMLHCLKGTPARPCPSGLDAYSRIEESENPNSLMDAEGEPAEAHPFEPPCAQSSPARGSLRRAQPCGPLRLDFQRRV